MRLLLLSITCLVFYHSNGQIDGLITNNAGIAISNAGIILKDKTGNSIAYAISKGNGSYAISYKMHDGLAYTIEVRHVNYATQQKEITAVNTEINFVLTPTTKQLKEVVVKARLSPVRLKTDTLEFKANAYITPETIKVQDLLKNIPGFKIDADGNITYNGQQVEKILLDGDDLAGTSYKLISKNLAAGIIDTVQLIKNYNENRLLKDVTKSDKIGINLKVNPNVREKFSGTASLSGSFNKRYETDVNIIGLKPKAKWLGLFNFNNISNNTAGDINYHYSPAYSANGILNNDNSIVKTGMITMPSIGTKYTYDNNDVTSAIMFSKTFKKNFKLKGAIGYNQQKLNNISNGDYITVLDSNTQWHTKSLEKALQKADQYYAAFNVTNDNFKKTIQELNVKFNATYNNNHYISQTEIAVVDALSEQLKDKGTNFQANYSATFKLSSYKVCNVTALFNKVDTKQQFNAATERFHAFFNLPADYKWNTQTLKTNKMLAEVSSMINGKLKSNNYIYGLTVSSRLISTSNSIVFNSENHPPVINPSGKARFNVSQLLVKGAYIINDAKNSFSIGGSSGFAKASLLTKSYSKNIFVAHSIFTFSRRFTNLQALSVSYQYRISIPNPDIFYPINIISGNASILYGGEEIRAERKYIASASFNSSNFFSTLNYYVNVRYSYQNLNYGQNLFLNPNYIILYQAPQKNNSQLNVNSSIEKYFSPLKSKFSLQLSSTISNGYSLLNNYASRNNFITLELFLKWNSAFKFPLNVEAQYNPQYFINKTT